MPTSSHPRDAHCARGAARACRTAPEEATSDRQERKGNHVACLLAFLAVVSRELHGMVVAARFEELAMKPVGQAAGVGALWLAVGAVQHGNYSVREHERIAALIDRAGSSCVGPQTDSL